MNSSSSRFTCCVCDDTQLKSNLYDPNVVHPIDEDLYEGQMTRQKLALINAYERHHILWMNRSKTNPNEVEYPTICSASTVNRPHFICLSCFNYSRHHCSECDRNIFVQSP